MSMPRRSKDKIIAHILEVCRMPGVIKTKIVYQVNMNFNTIRPYLDLLIKNGLIEATSTKYPIYKTTPKGEMALDRLKELEEKIPESIL